MLQIMKNYFYIIHHQLATKHCHFMSYRQRKLFDSHFLMPTLIPSRVLSMASTSSDKLQSVLLNCDKSIRTIRELKQKIEHSAKTKRTIEESNADVWEQKFDYVNEKFVCCHNIWDAARLAVQNWALSLAARSQIEEDLEIRNRMLPKNGFVEIQEENCIDLSELEMSGEALNCGSPAANEEAIERFSCDEQMKTPEAECAQEYGEEEDLSYGENDLDATNDVDPDQLEQYNKQLKEFVHGMRHLPPPAGLKHKKALIRFFMKASI
uniref:Uncharacterized protein n=1 Tax=Globodera rostochiensis TaxID=31243 RepID=A0A914H4A6_GLORO